MERIILKSNIAEKYLDMQDVRIILTINAGAVIEHAKNNPSEQVRITKNGQSYDFYKYGFVNPVVRIANEKYTLVAAEAWRDTHYINSFFEGSLTGFRTDITFEELLPSEKTRKINVRQLFTAYEASGVMKRDINNFILTEYGLHLAKQGKAALISAPTKNTCLKSTV